jgi:RHS repeat-associated protein
VVAATGAADLHRWTARAYDDELNLMFHRARHYDPATGRWLSPDPLGFAAGDVNLYRYLGNGPTLATDPSGLKKLSLGRASDPQRWLKSLGEPRTAPLDGSAHEAIYKAAGDVLDLPTSHFIWELHSHRGAVPAGRRAARRPAYAPPVSLKTAAAGPQVMPPAGAPAPYHDEC